MLFMVLEDYEYTVFLKLVALHLELASRKNILSLAKDKTKDSLLGSRLTGVTDVDG